MLIVFSVFFQLPAYCANIFPHSIVSSLSHFSKVRRGGCHPTTLGLAPYPPKFAPMRPSFRVCWHKLRLFLLTQYSAIVALDSDIVVLSNIDELVTKVSYCCASLFFSLVWHLIHV